MDRNQLLEEHGKLTSMALELMKKKNADYGANEDPFRNFHMWGSLGILVRMGDKMARLQTFEERGEFSVEDERLLDTILDLINYAVLYHSYKIKDKV